MRTEKHTESNFVGNLGITNSRITALSWFHFAWQYLGITTGIPKT
jgi:hypothetical protein